MAWDLKHKSGHSKEREVNSLIIWVTPKILIMHILSPFTFETLRYYELRNTPVAYLLLTNVICIMRE